MLHSVDHSKRPKESPRHPETCLSRKQVWNLVTVLFQMCMLLPAYNVDLKVCESTGNLLPGAFHQELNMTSQTIAEGPLTLLLRDRGHPLTTLSSPVNQLL